MFETCLRLLVLCPTLLYSSFGGSHCDCCTCLALVCNSFNTIDHLSFADADADADGVDGPEASVGRLDPSPSKDDPPTDLHVRVKSSLLESSASCTFNIATRSTPASGPSMQNLSLFRRMGDDRHTQHRVRVRVVDVLAHKRRCRYE